MTSSEATATSNEILEFLRSKEKPVSASELVRTFCQEKEVDPTLVEIALSLLLNKGLISTNRDMRLEDSAVAA